MLITCYNTLICSNTVDNLYFLASLMQVIPGRHQSMCFHLVHHVWNDTLEKSALPVMILEAELHVPLPLSLVAGCGGGGMLGLGRGLGAGLAGRGSEPEW